MSQDELTPIWRNRMRVLFTRQDVLIARVDGIALEMQWVRSRLAPNTTDQTPSSPPSSSSQTATLSPIRSALSRAASKMGREALTQFAMWLAAKIAMWVLPWLVAWWTMGGPLLRFLERWVAFFLG
jgi:hypothetical protein